MAYTGKTPKRLLVPGVVTKSGHFGRYRYWSKKNKYRAKTTFYEGHFFDSKAEARRFRELKLLERAGEITNIRIHPKYLLFVNGKPLASYRPDFVYVELKTGQEVAEDVKSKVTARLDGYSLRKKLFIACYPKIQFRELITGAKVRLNLKKTTSVREKAAAGDLLLTKNEN